jgi:hypothetical protein
MWKYSNITSSRVSEEEVLNSRLVMKRAKSTRKDARLAIKIPAAAPCPDPANRPAPHHPETKEIVRNCSVMTPTGSGQPALNRTCGPGMGSV